jgi:hypothetical protein
MLESNACPVIIGCAEKFQLSVYQGIQGVNNFATTQLSDITDIMDITDITDIMDITEIMDRHQIS